MVGGEGMVLEFYDHPDVVSGVRKVSMSKTHVKKKDTLSIGAIAEAKCDNS